MPRTIERPQSIQRVKLVGMLVAAASIMACAEQHRPAEEPPKAGAGSSSGPSAQPAPKDEGTDAQEEVPCTFIANGACFSAFEAACDALDCPAGKCSVTPSLPPTVTCQS